MSTTDRERPRQGSAVLRDGVPYANPESTLSLLAAAPINEWLADNAFRVRGRLLDVGAGNRPYAVWYEPLADETVAVDAVAGDGIQVLGLADRLPFAPGSFDTILCTEVLEHVFDAERATRELYRVARPGAHVLVSVPYLYPTHEAPYDFRRLTHYGLRDILERAGFEVVSLESRGRLGLLLAHYLVIAVTQALELVGGKLGTPLLERRALRAVVAGPQRARLRWRPISRTLAGTATRASLGYLAVARRPG